MKKLLILTYILLLCGVAHAQSATWSQKVYTSGSPCTVLAPCGWPSNPPSSNPTGTYAPYCTVPANQPAQQTLLYNPVDGMLEVWFPDTQSSGHEWGQALFAYDPNQTSNACPGGGSSGGFFMLYDSMIHQNGGNSAVAGTAINSITWSTGTVTVVTTSAGFRSFCGPGVGNPWPWCAGPSTISVGSGNAPVYSGGSCLSGDNTGIMNGSTPDCAYNGQYVLTGVSGCTGAPTYQCSTFTYSEPNTPLVGSYTNGGSGAQPLATTIIGPADTALTPVGRHSEGSVIDSSGNFWMGSGVGDEGAGATRIYTHHAGINDLYEAIKGSPSGCGGVVPCYVFTPKCGIANGTWCATPNAQVNTPAGNGIPCNAAVACGYNFPLSGYDAKYNVLVFFGGGWSSVSQCETLLYAINTGTWTNLETVYPCPTSGFTGGTYPYARWAQSQSTIPGDGNGNLIMFGFQYTSTAPLTFNDTWVLHLTSATAGTWTRVQDNCQSSCPANQPPPTMNPMLSYVSALNEVLLVDGQSPAHIWAFRPSGTNWAAGTWTDLHISSLGSVTGSHNTFCTALSSSVCQNNSPTNFNAIGAFDPSVTDAINCNQSAHATIVGCFVVFVKNANVTGTNAVQIWMLPVSATTVPGTITQLNAVAEEGWGGDTLPGSTGRINAPVTTPIPLADSLQIPGTIGGLPSTLALKLGNGTQINSQFDCIEHWPDGYCKFVKFDYQLPTYTDTPTVDTTVNLVQVSSGGGNVGGSNILISCNPTTNDAYCQNTNQYLFKTATSGTPACGLANSICVLINVQNNDLVDEVNLSGQVSVAASRTKSVTTDGALLMGPAYVGNVIASTQCAILPTNTCTTPYSSLNDSSSTATVEENGPLRAVLRIDGNLKDSSGDIYLGYTLRYEFWAHHSDFHIRKYLRNAYCSGAPCALGNPSVEDATKQFGSFQLLLTNSLNTSVHNVRFGNSSATPSMMTLAAGQTGYMFTGYTSDMQWSDWNANNCTSFSNQCVHSYVQRQCIASCGGGPNASPFTYALNGVEIVNGAGTEVGPNPDNSAMCATTSGAPGWMAVDDGGGSGSIGSIEMGIFHPCAYWPKGLEDTAIGVSNLHSTMALDIWPLQTNALVVTSAAGGPVPYSIEWGHYQIHDVYLNFQTAPTTNQVAQDTYLQEEHPIRARPGWSYYNSVSDASSGTLALYWPFINPPEEDAYYCAIGLCGSGTNCPASVNCIPDFTEIPSANPIPPQLTVVRYYAGSNGGAGNQSDFEIDYERNCLQRWPTSASIAGFLPARCTFAEVFWPRFLEEGAVGGRSDGFDWRDTAHCGAFAVKCAILDVNGFPNLVPWNALSSDYIDKNNSQEHAHYGGLPDMYGLIGDRDIYDLALSSFLNVAANSKIGNNNPAACQGGGIPCLGVARAIGWLLQVHARMAVFISGVGFIDTVGGCATVLCSVGNVLAGGDLSLAWQEAPFTPSGGLPANVTENYSQCPFTTSGQTCSPDTTGGLAAIGINPQRGYETALGGPSTSVDNSGQFTGMPTAPSLVPTSMIGFSEVKPYQQSILAYSNVIYGLVTRDAGITGRGPHWTLPFTGVNSGAQTNITTTIGDWFLQNWAYGMGHFSTFEAFTMPGSLGTGSNSTCVANCQNSGHRYVLYPRYYLAEPGCSLNTPDPCDVLCPVGKCIGTTNDGNWVGMADTVGASVDYTQNEPYFQQSYEYYLQKTIPANSGDAPEWAGAQMEYIVGLILNNPSPTTYMLGSPATLQYVPGGVTCVPSAGCTSPTTCLGGAGGLTCTLTWLTPIPGLTKYNQEYGSLQFYACPTAGPDCNFGNGKTIIDDLQFYNYLHVGTTNPVTGLTNPTTVNAGLDPNSNTIPGAYVYNPSAFWPWSATTPVEAIGAIPNIASGTYTFHPAANTTYTFAIKAYQPPVTTTTCPPSVVSVQPSSVNFGTIPVGTPAPANLILCNETGFTVNGITQTVTGTNAADFPYSLPVSNPCGTSLAATSQCNYTDTFTPTIPSAESASFNVTYKSNGSGGTIRMAADCSQASINTAISSAVAGDTVLAPGGTAIWSASTPVAITSPPITLNGGGCTITEPAGGSGTAPILTLTAQTSASTFITGFNFSGNYNNGGCPIQLTSTNTSKPFRFYGNTLDDAGASGSGEEVCASGLGTGVIDSNTLTTHFGGSELIHNLGTGSPSNYSGWSNDVVPGGSVGLFVENNTFTNTAGTIASAIENYYGSVLTFRHNTLTNAQVDIHGTTPGTCSSAINNGRWYEIYDNQFGGGNGLAARGGSGVAWGNTNIGPGHVNIGFVEDCTNGTYPLQYQVGRGINGTTSSPAYAWNNDPTSLPVTTNSPVTYVQIGSSTGACASVSPNHSVCDVVNTPTSTPTTLTRCESAADVTAGCLVTYAYTPYTYPHPLTMATINVPLSGFGAPVGGVTSSPLSLTFAPTIAGSGHSLDSPKTVTLTNTSAGAITISSVTIATANSADFGIGTNTCSGSIPNTGLNTCTVQVYFSPLLADQGSLSSLLHIVYTGSGGGTLTTTLAGQSNPPPTIIPPSLLQPTGLGIGP
jgi:hypothetical protein